MPWGLKLDSSKFEFNNRKISTKSGYFVASAEECDGIIYCSRGIDTFFIFDDGKKVAGWNGDEHHMGREVWFSSGKGTIEYVENWSDFGEEDKEAEIIEILPVTEIIVRISSREPEPAPKKNFVARIFGL